MSKSIAATRAQLHAELRQYRELQADFDYYSRATETDTDDPVLYVLTTEIQVQQYRVEGVAAELRQMLKAANGEL